MFLLLQPGTGSAVAFDRVRTIVGLACCRILENEESIKKHKKDDKTQWLPLFLRLVRAFPYPFALS
jgi:hypothetical protein